MFLMREGLECRISILKHCLMTDEAVKRYQSANFYFPFAETRSVDVTSVDRQNAILHMTFYINDNRE